MSTLENYGAKDAVDGGEDIPYLLAAMEQLPLETRPVRSSCEPFADGLSSVLQLRRSLCPKFISLTESGLVVDTTMPDSVIAMNST